jgi:hypothetical protein
VTYSSQGSNPGQLDFCNWLADHDGIIWIALRSVKNNIVDFINQIRYLSIKYLPNSPQEAGWTPFQI